MEVIQIPLTDQQPPLPKLRTRTFFIVNDALDEKILRDALDKLIRDHWRKLGGRLAKRKEDGLFEYHVPEAFEEDHVLFSWSSAAKEQSIDDAFPSLKPSSTANGVTFFPSVTEIDPWFRPSDWPFHTFDAPDGPLLYVHVSLFPDATVIATSLPHLVADQLGLGNIMKAWLGMVGGKTPPDMIGYKEDPLENKKSWADYPKATVSKVGRLKVMQGKLDLFLAILALVLELILEWKEAETTILFPTAMISSLRARLSKELEQKYGKDPGISNSDVLAAVLTKLGRINQPSRMIVLTVPVNLRGRVPQLPQPQCDGFIHNSIHYAGARFRLEPSTRISEIAYHHRKAILTALDPQDIEVGLAVQREKALRGQDTLISEPLEKICVMVSWTGAWRGLDFSGAVKASKKGETPAQDLQPLVLGQSKEIKTPMRFLQNIMCKTDDGYWCAFYGSVRTLATVKEYLKKNPLLENL